jgi:hypothetical protein
MTDRGELPSSDISREAIMDVNPDKLNAFMGKMVGDMGAAANAALVKVGDRLGL